MLTEKKKEALKLLYQTLGIPFTIIKYDHGSVFSCPEGYDEFLNQNQSMKRPKKTLSKSEHPAGVTLIGVGEMAFFAVCKIDEDHYAFTCPVSSSTAGVLDFIRFKGYLAEGRSHDFFMMLKSVPLIEKNQLAGYVSMIKFICTDEIHNDMNFYQMISSDIEITTDRTELENEERFLDIGGKNLVNVSSHKKMFNAVKDGDIARIEEILRLYNFERLEKFSENNIQNLKYIAVYEIQSAATYAIEGGLNSEYACKLAESWCQVIDKMNDEMAIERFRRNCLTEFCRKVSDEKPMLEYSNVTRKVVAYIHSHIYEELKVNDIVGALEISRSTLSQHFTKDMGISLHKYIISEKLKLAERFLKDESFTYSEISDMVGFSDQSHFIQLFKHHYGITPGEFRKSLGLLT